MSSIGIIPDRGRGAVPRPVKAAFTAGVLLILLGAAGCQKPTPPGYLLRYHFQPGDILQYDVYLTGEGTVTMEEVGSKKEGDRLVLPVRIQGSYLLEAAVESVSPEGTAAISVSYKDFHLTMTNRVRDRESTIILTDRSLRTVEGETVKKEITADDEDFPLRGISGETFTVEVDPRGRIIAARVPPSPGRRFPYLKFDNLWERIQPEFPETEVPVGAGWSREVEIPAPGAGSPWDRGETWAVKLDSTFRGFQGKEEKIALIDFTGRYEQESLPEEGGRPLSGVKRSTHLLTGTVEFDIKDGLVLSSRSRLKQGLDLLMVLEQVIPGKNLQARIDDATEITVTLRATSRRR
ncbi:MAG: hypothetical protein V1789_01985 [PVC group bacterium]